MLNIINDLCIGCGICQDICPFSAITVGDGHVVVSANCTLCGACVEHCPVDAIVFPRNSDVPNDLSGWSGVLVFCEIQNDSIIPVSLELLGIGRELSGKTDSLLSAIILGPVNHAMFQQLFEHGADKVYTVDEPELSIYNDEMFRHVLTSFIEEHRPEIVLAGATAIGRSFFPAVATSLGTGLTADCTHLDIRPTDHVLLQTRPALGGNIMATIVCEQHRPQMATVRPGVMNIKKTSHRQGTIISWTPHMYKDVEGIQVIESVRSGALHSSLDDADVIVSGGAGLRSEKGADLVYKLATLLGAKVAASRTAVDNGWFPVEFQVGQTGKSVAPKLYIACGISGAIQHVAGISGAGIVVAINSDPDAIIFEVADYGIVGKVEDILPELIERLEQREGKTYDT